MAKARRFKKKLDTKARKRHGQVLSVEFIRKETLEKLRGVWKKLISRIRSIKLAN